MAGMTGGTDEGVGDCYRLRITILYDFRDKNMGYVDYGEPTTTSWLCSLGRDT